MKFDAQSYGPGEVTRFFGPPGPAKPLLRRSKTLQATQKRPKKNSVGKGPAFSRPYHHQYHHHSHDCQVTHHQQHKYHKLHPYLQHEWHQQHLRTYHNGSAIINIRHPKKSRFKIQTLWFGARAPAQNSYPLFQNPNKSRFNLKVRPLLKLEARAFLTPF